MRNPKNFQFWQRSVVLGAGDADKEIMPAPGVGKFLVATRITVTILVSAAQSFDIESVGGAVELMKIPVSPTVGLQFHFGSDEGFALPENIALEAQTSAAGNSALITAEGYTIGKF